MGAQMINSDVIILMPLGSTLMATASIEQLTDPSFVDDLASLSIEEIRRRRGLCQSAEEVLSFRRRLIQGRLDIVQSELYRRSGHGSVQDAAALVESLPDILVEHGDRHLGPGRLTSLDTNDVNLGDDFDAFETTLEAIVSSTKLADFTDESDASIREVADKLDQLEREMSGDRHKLHKHIDYFQEEIVRRYKTGEASVEGLLGNN